MVNDVALAVADEFPGQMPDGSIIVKENYMSEDTANPGPVAALTVMYKVNGYNPEGSDWFWLKVSPAGEVEAEGKLAGCMGCHLNIVGNKDGLTRYGFGDPPAVTSLATIQPGALPKAGDTLGGQGGLLAAGIIGLFFVGGGIALRLRRRRSGA